MNYSDIEDNKLCQLYCEGDERAFTELYKRYDGLVRFRLNKYISHDKQEIDDITQEIWSTSARYIKQSFKGDAEFTTYLYRIIFTRYLNHFRCIKADYSTEATRTVYDHFVYGDYEFDHSGQRYGAQMAEHFDNLQTASEDNNYPITEQMFNDYMDIVYDVLKDLPEDEQKFYAYRDDPQTGLLQASRETGVSYWIVKQKSKQIATEIEERWDAYRRNYY